MLPNLSRVGVVILAAGKGTRLNCFDQPKVMLEIGGRPIVSYVVETLKQAGFKKEQICLVVGFKKEKIQNYFGSAVSYAVQEEQLGTAHAAYVGSKSFSKDIEQVLVMGGDDGAFYKPETILKLIERHFQDTCTVTLLTANIENFNSFGRVVKDENGIMVVEKEYLTDEQKKITEVSTGTYVFDRVWYEKIFPNMPKLSRLGEYGLNVSLVMAQEEGKKVETIRLEDNNEWHGINTLEELELANKLKRNI